MNPSVKIDQNIVLNVILYPSKKTLKWDYHISTEIIFVIVGQV